MKYILIVGLLFITGVSFSQDYGCRTDQFLQEYYADDPNWESRVDEMMQRAALEGGGYDRATYTIPVVVHIIHDGGESNISYEQVESAIQQMNEDYSRTNTDTINTRNTANAPFKPIATSMDIEFKLAKLDPDGNCTNGVERRYSPATTVNSGEQAKLWSYGGLDQWDRWSYLNIWVVESIEGDGGGTTLGYAYLPYSTPGDGFGILIRHDSFGTIGTASGSRTLTHEMGHTLGLRHTFQGGCDLSDCILSGDKCCDTPPVDEAHWSCSPSQNYCGVPSGDYYGFDAYDQFENYMSYSPCQNMFSKDQSTLVYWVLDNVSIFSSMTSSANLAETGVDLPDVLCKSDFSFDRNIICAGESVDYTDMSYANITGWNWTFDGGSPATSTDPNPTVTYNTAGTYSVTLQVTDGTGFETEIKTDLITVLDNPGDPLPYVEGFETITSIPDNEHFLITNEDGGQAFKEFDEVGYASDNCVRLRNFGLGNETMDELISAPIDLSGVDPTDDMNFTFHYAYKRRFSSNQEILRFYISSDCGETWILRKQLKGDDLGPEVQSSSYEPESDDEWYEVTIDNITSTYYVSNFMYKFQFTNDKGNNLYIDKINMWPNSMTDIETSHIANLSAYPNPVSDVLEISLDMNGFSQAEVTLHNALGQEIATIFNGQMSFGTSTLSYNMNELPNGVYYVQVAYGTETESIKVIKM